MARLVPLPHPLPVSRRSLFHSFAIPVLRPNNASHASQDYRFRTGLPSISRHGASEAAPLANDHRCRATDVPCEPLPGARAPHLATWLSVLGPLIVRCAGVPASYAQTRDMTGFTASMRWRNFPANDRMPSSRSFGENTARTALGLGSAGLAFPQLPSVDQTETVSRRRRSAETRLTPWLLTAQSPITSTNVDQLVGLLRGFWSGRRLPSM